MREGNWKVIVWEPLIQDLLADIIYYTKRFQLAGLMQFRGERIELISDAACKTVVPEMKTAREPVIGQDI